MAAATMNIEQARFNMIEQQIRPWEVLDPTVLELLSVVKREAFVPAVHKDLAFADVEIPLGSKGINGQTMLAPIAERNGAAAALEADRLGQGVAGARVRRGRDHEGQHARAPGRVC